MKNTCLKCKQIKNLSRRKFFKLSLAEGMNPNLRMGFMTSNSMVAHFGGRWILHGIDEIYVKEHKTDALLGKILISFSGLARRYFPLDFKCEHSSISFDFQAHHIQSLRYEEPLKIKSSGKNNDKSRII